LHEAVFETMKCCIVAHGFQLDLLPARIMPTCDCKSSKRPNISTKDVVSPQLELLASSAVVTVTVRFCMD